MQSTARRVPARLLPVALCLLCCGQAAAQRQTAPSPTTLAADKQDPARVSDDPVTDARYHGLIKQAMEEWEHRNWKEARALFVRAHALVPSARTLRATGMTAFEARLYVDSVIHLEAALVEPRRPLTPVQRTETEALL